MSPPHPATPSPAPQVLRTSLRGIIYAVFFLSGAAALAYEISWSRQIGLLFGHTATAAAIVLASYFAGLAGGYWIGGRLATRVNRPLIAYGICEIVAGLWAIAVPFILRLLELPQLARLIHQPDPMWQTIIRSTICLLLLLPAAIALGGTLPLMARWLESDDERSTSRIAWAYGLNTFGGLVGVLGTTWFMLSVVGVTASGFVAAGVSLGCGLIAMAVGGFERAGAFLSETENAAIGASAPSEPAASLRLLAALVAVCGFVTLALEVLYTRMFALVFHNSTYTFGLVIAVVLLGLAGGAWVAAFAGLRVRPLRAAGWANLFAGGAVAVSTLVFVRQTDINYFQGGETFAGYMLASLGLVALVVLPPSLLLGTILPLLWSAATLARGAREGEVDVARSIPSLARRASVSGAVGQLTAFNTLSAAAGALAASFLLLPALGLWAGFAALAGVCVLAGLVLLTAHAKPSPLHLVAAFAVTLVIFAAWRTTAARTSVSPESTLVHRSESAYGWIDVIRHKTGKLSLRENVSYTHGSTASAHWERRQGQIPLLLHPQPRHVLFLGIGTGATASAATMHEEVESIAIVELIPQVVEAARMFTQSNLNVLDEPRTEIHIDDARHWLLATDRRFDVIVSDLFVPWESKTGYLYTVDHYRVARRRLAPGGIFCQWLPMWQLGEREFEMIADSFAEIFPHTTVWLAKGSHNRAIVGLIGSDQPLELDGDQLAHRIRALAVDVELEDLDLNEPKDLSRRFIGAWPLFPSLSGRGQGEGNRLRLLNTDEHPRLEFAMPLTYADHRTLKGRSMQDYHRDTLTRLPQTGVGFRNFDEHATEPADRHWWQSVRLRM